MVENQQKLMQRKIIRKINPCITATINQKFMFIVLIRTRNCFIL